MIDPSISLGVKPVQIEDPLQVYGKVQNLMALKQQQQLQQQQMESGALQLQQQKQGIADDQAGRALFAGVQAGGSMPDDASILARLGPTHGVAIVKSLREADKAKVDLQETKGKVAVQEQDYAGGLASMVKEAGYSPDAVQLAIAHAHQAGYEQQAQQLQQLLLPENQGKIKPLMDSLIQQSPAQQKLINEGKTATGAQQRGQAAADNSQRAADLQPFKVAETQAQTASLEARTPGEKAKSDIEVASASALKSMTRDDWQKSLDATVTDKASPLYQRTQAAINTSLSRGDLKGAQDSIKEAGAQLGHTESAIATEKALSPLRIQQHVAEQVALAKLSPDSFNGIQDPRARTAAMGNYEKDSKEYADKVAAGEQLQAFVKAAQSGNKAAPGLIPIAELRSIVNRVNRQELESVSSSAGSAWDRIQGKIGSLTSGQPLPPELLKDIASISETMTKGARRTYENKVQINNKTYGGSVKPIDLPSSAAASIFARDPQGQLHEAPAGTSLPAGWKEEKR